MPRFRRTAEPAVVEAEAEPAPAGKGRPTPKRREAQQRRRTPVTAPTDRREAARRRRALMRERRREQRRALTSGDERHLPARDAGPARRYVRDLVDGRKANAGALFLPAALVLLFASTVRAIAPYLTFGYFLLLLAVIVDGVLLAHRVKRAVRERFGARAESGVALYAVTRSMQIRRLRMPPAAVRRGEPPRR